MTVFSFTTSLLQLIFILACAPLLNGIMLKLKARAERRVGPPIFQTFFDLAKLFKKERLRSQNASIFSALAPVVLISSTVVVIIVSPILSTQELFKTSGDLFAIVFILLVGSLMIALLGLDPGTPFGGLGSSRAMTISSLSEPALLVSIVAISIQAKSTNLSTIVSANLSHPIWLVSPPHLLAIFALLIVIFAEAGRIPVDNPATHLELTMIYEAMILESSGEDLALIKLGEFMRFTLLLLIVANLFFPFGIDTQANWIQLILSSGISLIKLTILGSLVTLLEVTQAKLRLFRVPELLAGAFVLAVLAVISEFVA